MTSIIKVDQIQNAAGTTGLTIDSSGRVTLPYQPAFYWTKTSTQTSTVASEVVVWDSSKVNVGSHFNNQRFTAPVAGVYHFSVFSLSVNDALQNDLQIVKNGSTMLARQRNASSNNHETTSCSCIIDLDVDDYIEVKIGGVGDVVYGDSGDGWSGFSGYLIG